MWAPPLGTMSRWSVAEPGLIPAIRKQPPSSNRRGLFVGADDDRTATRERKRSRDRDRLFKGYERPAASYEQNFKTGTARFLSFSSLLPSRFRSRSRLRSRSRGLCQPEDQVASRASRSARLPRFIGLPSTGLLGACPFSCMPNTVISMPTSPAMKRYTG